MFLHFPTQITLPEGLGVRHFPPWLAQLRDFTRGGTPDQGQILWNVVDFSDGKCDLFQSALAMPKHRENIQKQVWDVPWCM